MTPVEKLLILAMATQAILAMLILVMMGRIRVPLVMSGAISPKDAALSRAQYPERAQLPVLFYVACLLALWSGGATVFEAALALAFVALRYGHAYIHVALNKVHYRFAVYTTGLAVLAILWLMVLLRLLLS
jgi:hypothetical protein